MAISLMASGLPMLAISSSPHGAKPIADWRGLLDGIRAGLFTCPVNRTKWQLCRSPSGHKPTLHERTAAIDAQNLASRVTTPHQIKIRFCRFLGFTNTRDRQMLGHRAHTLLARFR